MYHSNLRQGLLQTGGIFKGRVHSEKVLNVFHLHYAGRVFKRNNHRSFGFCWRKTRTGKSHKITHRDTVLFKKLLFDFLSFFFFLMSTRKRKVGVLKFLRLEERFRKAQFRHGLVWTRPENPYSYPLQLQHPRTFSFLERKSENIENRPTEAK